MTVPQIRLAGPKDSRILAEMNEQLIVDQAHENVLRGEQLVDRMASWLNGEYEAALGSVDGRPALYALWRPEGDNAIYLRQFFVARNFRRLGLGKTAIDLLRADHWPAHCRVSLEVLIHNEKGIAFWRSVGFRDYSITMKTQTESGVSRNAD